MFSEQFNPTFYDASIIQKKRKREHPDKKKQVSNIETTERFKNSFMSSVSVIETKQSSHESINRVFHESKPFLNDSKLEKTEEIDETDVDFDLASLRLCYEGG